MHKMRLFPGEHKGLSLNRPFHSDTVAPIIRYSASKRTQVVRLTGDVCDSAPVKLGTV